jgi:FlaG/FlaF family flagellin (archaellin)
MITIVLAAFITVFSSGGVKEKGATQIDLEVAQLQKVSSSKDALFS